MLSAGQTYQGRYEVLAHIGEGSFAHVYRARPLGGGAPVALKILKDTYRDNPEVIERFQREVFAVASIVSPHIVQLKDFGLSDEAFFIVMEFIEGPTLRDVAKDRWSLRDVRVAIGQIAHALQAASDVSILHRDLKPENVMLVRRPDGGLSVKVLDFGFAKLPELERQLGLAPLTRKGFCFGTPQYMAPEQIRGRDVDGRVDLFALGVMTYELLAGRRPFGGGDPRDVMMEVLSRPAPFLTATEVPVPSLAALNEFFTRTLDKDPAGRPGTAREFLAMLEQALGTRSEGLALEDLPELAITGIASKAAEVGQDDEDQTVVARVAIPAAPGPQASGVEKIPSAFFPPLPGAAGEDFSDDDLPPTGTDARPYRTDAAPSTPATQSASSEGPTLRGALGQPLAGPDGDAPVPLDPARPAAQGDDPPIATIPQGTPVLTDEGRTFWSARIRRVVFVIAAMVLAYLAGRFAR